MVRTVHQNHLQPSPVNNVRLAPVSHTDLTDITGGKCTERPEKMTCRLSAYETDKVKVSNRH